MLPLSDDNLDKWSRMKNEETARTLRNVGHVRNMQVVMFMAQ
jgi:hypothetical protein